MLEMEKPVTLAIRPAQAADEDFLWECLALAAWAQPGEDVRDNPRVAKFLEGWRRPGDLGLIGEVSGIPIGAAWVRQFTEEERPNLHLDDRTPEIVIGLRPEHRRHGYGEVLLRALIDAARPLHAGLCLIVRQENPAIHLYEKTGFSRIPSTDIESRTGTMLFGMGLRF